MRWWLVLGVMVGCGSPDETGDDTAGNASCEHDGATWEDGESFDATDGCNTCDCEDGTVWCSELACTGR